ncbi:bifunctional 3-(3-hydroxy-phenyl)propionate/3-hydroxycinnamic acid hydroxylase [Salinibacterium sp. ZJ450]|uniref:bifunctional 3-(3-hydroxy-phenyl)propionate/3-hydroxycinnamic acid hydroxylase n=1 Tax=Salinibacterium sp. ZJ450 TaxID=2708338 RepID=UPI00174CE600|nr:bifunctional 3-(3-hydroxy-phenyl)propionate/3-hydroxycinnamic acid hydroxylase [Salinibacterium sp. ZJ450]
MTNVSSPQLSTDVAIIGAGPAGLSLANLLGRYGVRATLLEARDTLIDFPRGVGLDDESLRSMQAMKLTDAVLPHTTPQHVMRMVNGRGRVMVEIRPGTDEFGWSRRNGFLQPLVDRALYEGLARYEHIDVRFGHTVETLDDRGDHVMVTANTDSGTTTLRARFVVGADGGKSLTRHHIGTSFKGQSPSTRWLVVDCNDDPLGTPNVFLGADPRRPYVSIGLPHAVRRFEFMLFDHEPDELVEDEAFVNSLLAPHVTNPSGLNFIRKRVYTHHSRIAGNFRSGNIFLAGDAAHLMPVWQGQGYNSGVRDATNLAWKLASVVKGLSSDGMLDSYDQERHAHAKAMIDLSTSFGKMIKPTNRLVAGARDAASAVLNLFPSVKDYFAQMKYKPMPRYTRGVVVDASDFTPGRSSAELNRDHTAFRSANTTVSPVGTQFIQPLVQTPDGKQVLLDEVTGDWWSVLIWAGSTGQAFDRAALDTLRRMGAKVVCVLPMTQLGHEPDLGGSAGVDTAVIGDVTGKLKLWFDQRPTPVLFLRPDRFVAAACLIEDASATVAALAAAVHLTPASISPVLVQPVQSTNKTTKKEAVNA